MSSDRRDDGPVALVLVGATGTGPEIASAGPGEIRTLTFEEASRLKPWPSRPLVLLAAMPPVGPEMDRLRKIASRGRNPGWYVLGPPAELAALSVAWQGFEEGAIAAPLHAETLRLLARSASEEVVQRRAGNRAERRARDVERRMTTLSETLRAAASLLDPGMVSRFIMQRAATLVGSDWWRLYRLDETCGALKLDMSVEKEGREPPAEWLSVDGSAAGLSARTRQTIVFKDLRNDPRVDREVEWPGELPEELLVSPLVSRGRVIGVACLADDGSARFGARDVELVRTLMEPAAIALDNAQLFRKLEERTVTDDLTQLYNARFMENFLRRESKRAVRYGHPVSLLFIDLDGFKQVNDVHGHMAGSRTLVEVGDVLRENVREIDVVARWGGDEFAVVLPDTGPEGAKAMAERIRARISNRVYLRSAGLEVRVSASIGVASCPDHGQTAEEVLAGADAAMYRVKNEGKNGVALALPHEKLALIEA